MDSKNRFEFKAFLTYLVVEPMTDKFKLPNIRTILWGLIFFFLIFDISTHNNIFTPFLFGSLVLQLILYAIHEYRSGKYLQWYRERKYGEEYKKSKEALREIRRKKKDKETNQQTNQQTQ